MPDHDAMTAPIRREKTSPPADPVTTFLGLLLGLAVSSGVDRLERWRIPRGIGAALVVVTDAPG